MWEAELSVEADWTSEEVQADGAVFTESCTIKTAQKLEVICYNERRAIFGELLSVR